jgi:hypothetical protein
VISNTDPIIRSKDLKRKKKEIRERQEGEHRKA